MSGEIVVKGLKSGLKGDRDMVNVIINELS